jgi:uncharacterized Zn finger protein
MVEPKCPVCAVEGIDHIRSTESTERSRNRQPWFLVVHCTNCGHVYGVVAKHVFSEAVPPRLVLPDPG